MLVGNLKKITFIIDFWTLKRSFYCFSPLEKIQLCEAKNIKVPHDSNGIKRKISLV
jgi:hypothetical protein